MNKRYTINQGDTILFLGDSITDAGRERFDNDKIDYMNGFGWGFVNLIHGYLYASYPSHGFKIINKGNGGEQTTHVIARLEQDVTQLSPNVVILLIGTNDVWRNFDAPDQPEIHISPEQYRQNLHTILDRVKETTEQILVMTPFMLEPDTSIPMRKAMDEYAQIAREVAAEYALPVISLDKIFDDYMQHLDWQDLAPDHIHPSNLGHTVIAMTILEQLDIAL